MTHSSGASSSSLPSLASTAPTSATASAVQRRWCRREAAGEICEDGACRASHAVGAFDDSHFSDTYMSVRREGALV